MHDAGGYMMREAAQSAQMPVGGRPAPGKYHMG